MEFLPLWVDASHATPTVGPLEFVQNADAFYLRDGSLIGDPTLFDNLAAQITSGKRLIAELNPSTKDSLRALNHFLSRWFFPEHEQPDLFGLIRDAYHRELPRFPATAARPFLTALP